MAINYQSELNPEQYKVVTEADGPCLVLAGAGSGKTRTLVYRVAYLLEKGIKPENILLVTFTNKAAKEMIERIHRLLGFHPNGLNAGTFHHMGNLLLRKYADKLGYNRSFSILDQDDSVEVIKSTMNDLGLNVKGQNFPKPSVIQAVVSFARNANQPVEDIASFNYDFPEFIAEKIVQVAEAYEEKKKKTNAMDFDDLLINWYRLLKLFPEVKDRLSQQYQYVLVDEYQDTNHIQAAIIRELSGHHNNILVVGDDSQSIYSFRAADVNNILHFPKNFENTKVYHIETNYRSTPMILDLANHSIAHNKDKYDKKLRAIRHEGVMPCLTPARDVYQQATLIAQKIIEYIDRGIELNNIAVLFRAVFHSAELQLELAKRNIPFIVRGGMRYFEQAHIKDIISYLKIVQNFKDEIAWKRILRLYDGFGPASVEKAWAQIEKFETLHDLLNGKVEITQSKARIAWGQLVAMLMFVSSLDFKVKGSIGEAVIHIIKAGYQDYIKMTYDNYKDRMDDLHQFIDFVINYDDLDKLLADVMLSEKFSHDAEAVQNSVVLSTIHQAKGLEWKYVFIVGLRNGDFPHYKSLEDSRQMEEERRLFYVAVTRAKDELYMFYPVRKNSFQYGEMTGGPSQFIEELDTGCYLVKPGFKLVNQDDQPFSEEETIYY